MPCKDKAAFRCKTCGHLEGPEAAGENHVPHACSVCGSGITLNPTTSQLATELCDPSITTERRLQIASQLQQIARTGENQKHANPDNWEVLHDCDDHRLGELGLVRSGVCQHSHYEDEQGNKQTPKTVKAGPVVGRTITMSIAGQETVAPKHG